MVAPALARTALLALVVALPTSGCTIQAPPPRLEPRPVFDVHLPPQVQAGKAFAFYVDLDTACGTLDAITVDVDPAARTAAVGANFQPLSPGIGCQEVIIHERVRSTMTLATEGTHTIGFQGYERRYTETVEALNGAAPAWSPPPRGPGPSRP